MAQTKNLSPTIPLGKQVHVTITNGVVSNMSAEGMELVLKITSKGTRNGEEEEDTLLLIC